MSSSVSKASGVNGCMMCHNAAADCDACHRDLSVTAQKMPAQYQAIVPEILDQVRSAARRSAGRGRRLAGRSVA
mgnify:CR=1 FL=1